MVPECMTSQSAHSLHGVPLALHSSAYVVLTDTMLWHLLTIIDSIVLPLPFQPPAYHQQQVSDPGSAHDANDSEFLADSALAPAAVGPCVAQPFLGSTSCYLRDHRARLSRLG